MRVIQCVVVYVIYRLPVSASNAIELGISETDLDNLIHDVIAESKALEFITKDETLGELRELLRRCSSFSIVVISSHLDKLFSVLDISGKKPGKKETEYVRVCIVEGNSICSSTFSSIFTSCFEKFRLRTDQMFISKALALISTDDDFDGC